MPNDLLRIVRSAEHQGWQYFITFDELWFDLSIDSEIIELPDRQSPQKGRGIDSGKKQWSQSHEIFTGFTFSMSFQKEEHLMRYTIPNIFWNQFLFCIQNLGGVFS
jgi:hypothetical protein